MSTPTKIYLALVAMIAALWAFQAHVVGAGEIVYRGDVGYMLQNTGRLPAVLRGRVVLRDMAGRPLAVPEGTLTVAVSARDLTGTIAVRRIEPIGADGLFEVNLLPEGEATVAIQLGGGSTVWQMEGVTVAAGLFDDQLDPIDLGDLLFPIRLTIVDPDGESSASGHLVWRIPRDGASDDLSFEGDAPIRGGLATFLATAPSVDLVTLVPGASCELFEGVWDDGEVNLAPGVSVVLHPTGQVPSEGDWTLRVALSPVQPEPRIDYDADVLTDVGALIAPVEDGAARLALARGGTYRLEWWVSRGFQTWRFTARESTIEIPSGAGTHDLDVPFPMEEFVRQTSSSR